MVWEDYSAGDVIDAYRSQVATIETQLREFEEEAKDAAPDQASDRQQLERVASEWASPILDNYNEAERLKSVEMDRLKEELEHTLDNPKRRYTHLPQSLSKHEDMKEEIEDINKTLNDLEEWKDYLSYELEEETGQPLERYAHSTLLHTYVSTLKNRIEQNPYVSHIRKEVTENPDAAFMAGVLLTSAGALAADYVLDGQENERD